MPDRIPHPCYYPMCGNTTHDRYCERHSRSLTRVVLVTGPSGSGKSTLVKQKARRGDLVLDFDTLYQALSGRPLYDKPENLLPVVLSVREHIISLLGRVDGLGTAWIIRNRITDTEVNHLKRQLGAEVIELRVDSEECRRRIAQDRDRPQAQHSAWFRRIDEWWRDHG